MKPRAKPVPTGSGGKDGFGKVTERGGVWWDFKGRRIKLSYVAKVQLKESDGVLENQINRDLHLQAPVAFRGEKRSMTLLQTEPAKGKERKYSGWI